MEKGVERINRIAKKVSASLVQSGSSRTAAVPKEEKKVFYKKTVNGSHHEVSCEAYFDKDGKLNGMSTVVTYPPYAGSEYLSPREFGKGSRLTKVVNELRTVAGEMNAWKKALEDLAKYVEKIATTAV